MDEILIIIPGAADNSIVFDRDANSGFGNCYSRGRLIYPPFSAALAVSLLSKLGLSISLLDIEVNHLSFDKTCIVIEERKPDYIGICTSYISFYNDNNFAKRIKKCFPQCSVFLFGRGMNFLFKNQRLVEKNVDFVVWDDPPLSLQIKIPGHKNQLNKKETDNLELSISPSWAYFPLEKYAFISLETSRGCPFGSEWCPYPVNQGKTLKYKKIGCVRKEIEFIRKINKENKILQFRDPMFAFNRERAEKIISILEESNVDFEIGIETRIEDIDKKLLDSCARAGIRHINIGIETANNELLLRYKSGISNNKEAKIYLNRTKEVSFDCLERGIKPYLMFIFGFPEETEDTLMDTIQFTDSVPKEVAIQVSFFIPIPGTRSYESLSNTSNVDDLLKYDKYRDICEMPIYCPPDLSSKYLIKSRNQVQRI